MRTRTIALAFALSFAGVAAEAREFSAEDIFPLQGEHVHSSSIVQCPNGDYLTCWFQGSGERKADDVRVMGARLHRGRWSAPFLMADTPGFPDCNPVLHIDAKERLWLFWVPVLAHRWECSLLKFRRAEHYMSKGAPDWSWQDVIVLNPGDEFEETMAARFEELGFEEPMWAEYGRPYTEQVLEAANDPIKRQLGWMTRIHPLELSTGRILLPLYSDGFNACLVAISDDQGETWRASGPIIGFAPIQPALVERNDGTIVAYMRDSGGPPMRVLVATSGDQGETWSAARDTETPNPGSSLESIKLAGGNWLMVCNDTEDGRHRLSALLSDNEGETWQWRAVLEESQEGEGYAYPSVIQARDGQIHVTYSYSGGQGKTIRHGTFDEDWLKQSEQ